MLEYTAGQTAQPLVVKVSLFGTNKIGHNIKSIKQQSAC
jgi:hypothetical protein